MRGLLYASAESAAATVKVLAADDNADGVRPADRR